MGSVARWLDLAKWTCFGLYFALEDLTIVRIRLIPFSYISGNTDEL